MRELILAVMAEAEAKLDNLKNDDMYHHNRLRENEGERAKARIRLSQCSNALQRLDNAAETLLGKAK